MAKKTSNKPTKNTDEKKLLQLIERLITVKINIALESKVVIETEPPKNEILFLRQEILKLLKEGKSQLSVSSNQLKN